MNKVITQIDSRGVAQVTLNNPDKHNAFDDQMIIELTNAFNALAANANVRIMLLKSEEKASQPVRTWNG